MGANHLKVAATSVSILIALGGCGVNAVATQGGDNDEPPMSAKTAAANLSNRYAQLIATAVVRPVSDRDVRAAGVADDARAIRSYLDKMTCEFAEGENWKTGTATGESVFQRYQPKELDSAEARARLIIHHSAGTTFGNTHVLQLERRDGQWTVIADKLDDPLHGQPSQEFLSSELPGQGAVPASDTPPTPPADCG